MTMNVFYCDRNETVCTGVSEYFHREEDINMISCSNMLVFTKLSAAISPNAIILDKSFDGFDAVVDFSRRLAQCKLLVTGIENAVENAINELPFDAVYYKPFDELKKNILTSAKCRKESAKEKDSDMEKEINKKLRSLFLRMGVSPNVKGFKFLKEGINLRVQNPSLGENMQKRLYPAIASRFESSPSKVERAIRHAIETAWLSNKVLVLNTILGTEVVNTRFKLSNGQFIALVAEVIGMDSFSA